MIDYAEAKRPYDNLDKLCKDKAYDIHQIAADAVKSNSASSAST